MNGKIERCHVKNTGRCKELLVPGAKVILHRPDNVSHTQRVTAYDLIAVWKGERLINMDSQAPNRVFLEYLQSGKYCDNIACDKDLTFVKSEVAMGSSRLDFYVETASDKIYIEVKGVTLEENGVALFPDAPTERGIKHLNELVQCVRKGYEAQIVFVIQMRDVRYFMPNVRTHPAFGAALAEAADAGVRVLALDCAVMPHSLTIGEIVPVKISNGTICP